MNEDLEPYTKNIRTNNVYTVIDSTATPFKPKRNNNLLPTDNDPKYIESRPMAPC